MTNDTSDKTLAARRAIEKLLTAANGGKMPRITVHVVDDGAPVPPFDANGTTDTLFAAFDEGGGLDIAIGVRTHWTMLWSFDFRMARTPGGQLVLLGARSGTPVHATIDDGRFAFEQGSPLLTAKDEQETIVRFAVEFAALLTEAL